MTGGVSTYLRPDQVSCPVEDQGEAEEEDAARPHPPQSGDHAARGPRENVDEAEDGEQQSRLGVLVAQLLGHLVVA